ncbi:MAG: dockerin type I repeat-containing protein [candidate division Zixibacteria bacterium]
MDQLFNFRMETKALFISLFLCIVFNLTVAAEWSNFDDISVAYEKGLITRTEMLYEKSVILFTPIEISDKAAAISSDNYLKSATGLIGEIKNNWDKFTPDQKASLSTMLARPGKQCTYDSPLGYFKIYYDTSGGEATVTDDLDANEIPDFVERTGIYADSSYVTYVNNSGYYPAPLEAGYDKYEIFLVSIMAYGATVFEQPADSPWNDYTSYVMINRNFTFAPPNDDPEGRVIGAQKVTCAHEYFHAVQFGYANDLDNNLWWMEACATFMEECLFPEVNDNYAYLPFFFNVPEESLNSSVYLHMYGAFVWPMFLKEKINSLVIRDVWMAMRNNTPLDAVDSALIGTGKTLKTILPEFVIWNYFTGSRYVEDNYYSEAINYPEVPIDRYHTTLVHDSILPVQQPFGLASSYVEFEVGPDDKGIFEAILEGRPVVRWGIGTIFMSGDANEISHYTASANEPLYVYKPHIEDFDKVIITPITVTSLSSGNYYYLTTKLHPYGDANNDGQMNVGDAIYLINFIFKDGLPPMPIMECGDANCDGGVNVGDAVRIISAIFKGGEEPCSERIP